MTKKIKQILISKNEISKMVERIGAQITEDYKGKEVLFICVLKGAFIFLADLVRAVDLPVEVDFISVSSYGGHTETSGVVRIMNDLDTDITDKHVIIVEDIIDTGLTLNYLKDLLLRRNPASIAICTAFDKPNRRKANVKVDYTGLIVPDKFIVGYGLDYAGSFRHLKDVCELN